jgi:hypothetical protein
MGAGKFCRVGRPNRTGAIVMMINSVFKKEQKREAAWQVAQAMEAKRLTLRRENMRRLRELRIAAEEAKEGKR